MPADNVTFAARQSAIRSRALYDAENFVRSHIWALEDAAINELYQIYLDAYGSMSAQLVETFTRYTSAETWLASDLAFRQRTETILAQINTDVTRLMAQSTDTAFNSAVSV